jgi:LCP family protein required for cell wall assembly
MKRLLALVFTLLLLVPGYARGDGIIRVLIMGTDRLGYQTISETEEMSRADAILVLAVMPNANGIRLLNVERDYLVELPGGIGMNKLNTATYFGGPGLMLEAFNGLFQTDIRRYLQVDISEAIGIIDSLGGVDVNVREDELPILNKSPILGPSLSAGLNHFDGKKAQAFMRVRDMGIDTVESNKGRNDRQIRVLEALMKGLPGIGFNELMKAVNDISSLVKTNMSAYEVLLLAQAALQSGLSLSSLTHERTPFGAYRTRRVNMHQVIVVEDMEAEIRQVKDYLLYP